ncbi:PLP-dependent cysteine synthase family protein [Endozoicomonas sp. SM1973]|uniref:cysteine synthase n=1 Tax=Spartinivicinus marinus TaxID=2994442 RepID=A0A853I9J1_9GAMM|nr:PLP-dependent cysteine synthase family protein [Spartinivicinus marinus]MCX4024826.1 PLP-dependent cysteine synthase family protein [Spartinivicinus marinus]NYZ66531.1 PLP-dependent cysteine synthase family protein [Spartinivicinus marinus]
MELLDLVGNTPLINLSYFSPDKKNIFLYAKAEWVNPGGSLKDRPVKSMLLHALNSGQLPENRVILDSSSGNAGISYAMLGRAINRHVCIVIPGNASEERKSRLKAHGAELIETDPLEGYDKALHHVRSVYQESPDQFFFCNQYANPYNVEAHYQGTGCEIINQVKHPITHFIGGVGTGGSLTGIGCRLKEVYPTIKICAVLPERWPGIEGLKPLGELADIVPDIFQQHLVDEWVPIRADEAKEYCYALAHQGYFVGQSSGAYLAACTKIMKQVSAGVFVTLLNDLGERYFSAGLWS